MKMKIKIQFMHFQPPPWMKRDTIKKVILRRSFVIKNSQITFFPNDLKVSHPHSLKARTNFLFKIMCIIILLCVTTHIWWNSRRYTQPSMKKTPNAAKKFTLQKKMINRFLFPAITLMGDKSKSFFLSIMSTL